jgi:hypothetical protein
MMSNKLLKTELDQHNNLHKSTREQKCNFRKQNELIYISLNNDFGQFLFLS